MNVIVALIVFVTFSSELAAHPGTFVDTFCHASGGSYTKAGLSFVRIVWFVAAVGLGGIKTDIVGDGDDTADDSGGGSDSGDSDTGGGEISENVNVGEGVEIIRVEGVDDHVVDGVHDAELHTLALLDQTATALSLLLLLLLLTLPVTDEQSYAVVPVNVNTSVAVPASSWAATNA